MQAELTQSSEDYLKTIYDLTRNDQLATTNQIAEILNVKPASVTGMIQKLAQAEPPLVNYQKHHGVSLTPDGEMRALAVIRHHRLLETFLLETLGYEWDSLHEEACRLEHVISEQFEERLSQTLGDPSYDPHGDPIPDRDLKMPPFTAAPLTELASGQHATIQRVRDGDPDLLHYLYGHGIHPGAHLSLVECSPFDGNLHLQIEGQVEIFVIGPSVARQIYVEIDS